jgi:hypothetical protein
VKFKIIDDKKYICKYTKISIFGLALLTIKIHLQVYKNIIFLTGFAYNKNTFASIQKYHLSDWLCQPGDSQ